MSFVVGVDLGATTIKVGLVDDGGTIVQRLEAPTPWQAGAQGVLDRVAELVDQVGGREATALGVGSCGLVDARGRVLEATATTPGWAGTDLAVELVARTGLPCVADRDGNAATLAEAWIGAARGERVVAMLTLGTGVGGGVVLDGQIVHGAGSMAGSIGHLKVASGGRRCACGARGCLEAYASGWAFLTYEEQDAEKVFAAARAGDPVARRSVRRAAEALGTALSNVAHLLNPSVIVIGGGLSRSWDQLEPGVVARFTQASLATTAQGTRIAPAALGADAGLVGAALLTAV